MTQERERAGEKPTLSSCPHCRNGIKRVMLTDSVLAHEFSDGERAWCEQCVDLHAHQQAMQRLEDWIRERVALGHGCDLVYGDDGELQCSNLVRHGELLDFRRMPMEKVFEVDARCKLEAAAEFMKRRESEQQALREPPIVDPMHKVSESNTLCYDEARDSQDYAEALEASRRRLNTLLQERDTGRETVENLSLSVEALESELRLKTQALREAQEEIARLKGDSAMLTSQRNALEADFRAMQNSRDDALTERDEARERAQALEARVKQLEEQLAHAQQR